MHENSIAAAGRRLNGVDIDALYQTIDAAKADPRVADFQFRIRNQWQDGGFNRSNVQDFRACGEEDGSRRSPFVLDADEPAVLLGADRAANPVEHVLHALAACLTTSIVYHAAARGLEIRALESSLEGDLDLRGFLGVDAGTRPGYRSIRVRVQADSDADPAELRELARYSPVFDIVSRSVPVELSLECR